MVNVDTDIDLQKMRWNVLMLLVKLDLYPSIPLGDGIWPASKYSMQYKEWYAAR